MKDILTPEVITLIITAVIIPAIVKGLNLGAKALESKIGNQNFTKYIGIAEGAVETAVVSIGQTFVDTLKKEGSFDQGAKEEAFSQAKETAIKIMGKAAKDTVSNAYGDFNTWIDNQIEKHVKLLK